MNKQRFVWKAVDQKGVIQQGTWTGVKISEVWKRLRNEGYFPLKIRRKQDWPNLALFSARAAGCRWNDFAHRLAVLLEAGIPLLQALEIMTASKGKPTFQLEQWKKIKDRVEEGCDLSEAMALLNPAPNAFMISMIRAGEYTGTLGKVLGEVATELDQESLGQKKMKMALAYPTLLFSAVLSILYVLSVWVLPMYEKMFVDLGTNANLPLLSRVIFACGRKLPLFLGSCLGLLLGGLLALKLISPTHWRKRLQRLLGKLPLIGEICRLRDLGQFSRMLGRLLAAGIPLLEALQLTGGVMRSAELPELIHRLTDQVRQGRRMSPLLLTSPVFPKESAEMIAIGEETGQLERILHYVTEELQREFADRLNRLTRLLEPALILTVAGLVGLVAAGVMLPIFELSSQLQ